MDLGYRFPGSTGATTLRPAGPRPLQGHGGAHGPMPAGVTCSKKCPGWGKVNLVVYRDQVQHF